MNYVKIDKFSMIPLYSQLKESIKKAIEDGVLKAGDKLPTEQEICEVYGLSRTVTRQAFYELMNEGYINRYKSRGTFVNHQNPKTSFFKKIMSFNEEMELSGYKPKTKLLSLEEIPCSKLIADKLNINENDPVIRIQRVRYRDDIPVVYVDAYFKANLIKGIEDYDLENESLYDTLQKYYGIKIMKTNKTFTAKIITDEYAKILEVEKGSAVQYVESIDYNQENKKVSYDISIYPGDRNDFEVNITN